MSITRRKFLLGTTAGLILPSFYERAYSYFQNHGEPLLITPKRHAKSLYACSESAADGFRLLLGNPEDTLPPEMTIREFCIAYGEGDPEKWWRELWRLAEEQAVEQSVYLTASGAGGRGKNSLQSSFIADDQSAKNGGR